MVTRNFRVILHVSYFNSVSASKVVPFQFAQPGLNSAAGSGDTRDTCKRSEPCGWALYTPGSSPRKIYKYTRNIL